MAEDYSETGWRDRWEKRFFAAPQVPSWWANQKIRPLSLSGLTFLAIDEGTGELYWNGQKVHTRTAIRLEGWTLFFVGLASFATAGSLVIDFLRAVGVAH